MRGLNHAAHFRNLRARNFFLRTREQRFYEFIHTMNTITIAKKLAKRDDRVVIPLKEYKALLGMKKIKEFFPTAAQKKALVNAEQRLRKGKTLSHHECIKKLGFAH